MIRGVFYDLIPKGFGLPDTCEFYWEIGKEIETEFFDQITKSCEKLDNQYQSVFQRKLNSGKQVHDIFSFDDCQRSIQLK